MKKIALSLFVLLTFVIYSLQQRHENAPLVIAPLPKTSSQASSSASSSSSQPTSSGSSSSQTTATYKDGSYTGSVADAFYGNIQVRVTVSGGKITDVAFLQYPNDRSNSIFINQQAMPLLKQEAIQAQTNHVDIISGATDTSMAFNQSLAAALTQAI